MMKKKITVDTPCTATELENILHLVAHEGHWHDARVDAVPSKVEISYEDDMEEGS